jgi:hypothetical protein
MEVVGALMARSAVRMKAMGKREEFFRKGPLLRFAWRPPFPHLLGCRAERRYMCSGGILAFILGNGNTDKKAKYNFSQSHKGTMAQRTQRENRSDGMT